MGDSQDERVLLVPLERNQVGESLDGGFADHRGCRPNAWPCRIRLRGFANSIERGRNLGDELVAQAKTSFLVPKGGTAKLSTRFKMQFDAHAAARVPLGSRSAPSSSRQSERDPRRPPVNAALTQSPTPRRLHRLALPGWKAVPPQHERALGERDATPRQAAPRWTCRQCTTGRLCGFACSSRNFERWAHAAVEQCLTRRVQSEPGTRMRGSPRLSRKPTATSPAVRTNEAPGNPPTLNRSPPAAEPTVIPRLDAAVCLPSSQP